MHCILHTAGGSLHAALRCEEILNQRQHRIVAWGTQKGSRKEAEAAAMGAGLGALPG